MMQTYLRGRDMITTQEWTKDELDTVMGRGDGPEAEAGSG